MSHPTSITPKLPRTSKKIIPCGSYSKPTSKRSSGNFTTVNICTINNGDNINIEEQTPLSKMAEATNNMIDTLTMTTCEAAAEACEAAAESAENASKSAMKIAGRMVKKYKNNDDKIKQSQIQMAEVIAEAAVATATAAKLGAKVCRIGNKAMSDDPRDILKQSEEENSEEILKRAIIKCSSEDKQSETPKENSEDESLQPLKIISDKKRKRKNSTPCKSLLTEEKNNLKRSNSASIEERNVIDDIKTNIDTFYESNVKPSVNAIKDETFKTITNIKDNVDTVTENTKSHLKDGIDVIVETIDNVVDTTISATSKIINNKKNNTKKRGLTSITDLMDRAIEEFEENIEETKNETLNVITSVKLKFIEEMTLKKDELLSSSQKESSEYINSIEIEFKTNMEKLINILQSTINEHENNIKYLIADLEEKIESSKDGMAIIHTEIDRMLDELNNGITMFNNKTNLMKENYIKSLEQITKLKYNETIIAIKNVIALELEKVDNQLSDKFKDFNSVLDSVIASAHINEMEKIKSIQQITLL